LSDRVTRSTRPNPAAHTIERRPAPRAICAAIEGKRESLDTEPLGTLPIDKALSRAPATLTRILTEQPIIEIKPARGLVGLRLGELWRYRELLLFLAWRNVLVRYKQTVLGFLWAVLQPLLLMVVMTVFFGTFARRAGVPAPIYFFAGLVPWTYFANALTQSSNSLVSNANLISKVYFPRLAAPIAGTLAALVDFAAGFVVLGGMLVVYGVTPRPAALVVIPALVLLALLTALGGGLWLSALNVSYRDVQYVVPFMIQIGLFVSLFSGNVKSEPWHTLLGLNPMATVIEGFRWALTGSATEFSSMVILSIAASVVLVISGAIYFRQVERGFADVI
jgi:lipopolysaccharide transport system permease protein